MTPLARRGRAAVLQLTASRWAWAVGMLALLLNAAIIFDWSPYLRGPSSDPAEWRWPHVWPPNILLSRAWIPFAVLALIVAWWWWVRPLPRLNLAHLLSVEGLALAFRFAVQYVNVLGLSIAARVLNPAYFGYFLPATRVESLTAFLSHYAENQSILGYRLGTHPPGNVVFYWLTIKAVEANGWLVDRLQPFLVQRAAAAPAWASNYTPAALLAGALAAVLVPLLSVLSLTPIYYGVSMLAGEQPARTAVALTALIPAFTVFTPVIDDMFVVWTGLGICFAAWGLVSGRVWPLVCAGLAAGIGLFQSFSLIPLAVMLLLFIGFHAISQPPAEWPGRTIAGAAYLLGVITPWLCVWLVFGLNPFRVYANSLAAYDAGVRSYLSWLIYDGYDLLLFAGIPVAVHCIAMLARLVRQAAARRTFSIAESLTGAMLVTLVIVFVSGSLRGEAARIMLYVYPFIALTAALHVSGRDRPAAYVPLLLTLSAIQTVIFQTSLAPYQ